MFWVTCMILNFIKNAFDFKKKEGTIFDLIQFQNDSRGKEDKKIRPPHRGVLLKK